MSLKESAPLLHRLAGEATESGCYIFKAPGGGVYCSEAKIDHRILYQYHQHWVGFMAEWLYQNDGLRGMVGWVEPETNWIMDVAKMIFGENLEGGIKIKDFGRKNWGVFLPDRLESRAVAVFTNVNTLGGTLNRLQREVREYNLEAVAGFSLIDRHPRGLTRINGLPVFSLIHHPLPLRQFASGICPNFQSGEDCYKKGRQRAS